MNFWPVVVAALPVSASVAAWWGAFHPASQLFGRTVRRTGLPSALALTFDDGPNPAVTPRLLDLLDQYKAHATFFLIGKYVRACPELAREIAARGHSLGNHTDRHPRLLWLSPKSALDELMRCQDSIEQAAGRRPTLMRPPYGERGPQLRGALRRAGLEQVVMWSAAAHDWKRQPFPRLLKRLEALRGGEIVLLHDGDPKTLRGDRDHVVAALEYWLPRWRDAGFKFVSLDSGLSSK